MADMFDTGGNHGAHSPLILRILYGYLYESRDYRDDGISIHRLCRNYFLKREKKPVTTEPPEYFEHMDGNSTPPEFP